MHVIRKVGAGGKVVTVPVDRCPRAYDTDTCGQIVAKLFLKTAKSRVKGGKTGKRFYTHRSSRNLNVEEDFLHARKVLATF
jgi:hypothetical protein